MQIKKAKVEKAEIPGLNICIDFVMDFIVVTESGPVYKENPSNFVAQGHEIIF